MTPAATSRTRSSTGEIDTDAILRFTTAGPSRNLDPVLQTSYGGWGYLVLIYDRLTVLDKDDNVQPGLATEWSFAEDGSYLEMKLRDDVSFHDGTKFDAEAVKANIERGKTSGRARSRTTSPTSSRSRWSTSTPSGSTW